MLRDPGALRQRQRRVYVCENPTVSASAAEALGATSAPLVCIAGVSSTAATRLLAALHVAGVELRYHGDFDPAGIGIWQSDHGSRRSPLALSAEDYPEAATAGRSPERMLSAPIDPHGTRALPKSCAWQARW